MNYIILIIFFLILLMLALYIYYKINIILTNIFPKLKLRVVSFIIAILPIIMVISRIFSTGLIFIFYIVLTSLVIDMLNLYLKKFNNPIWRYLHKFLIIPIIFSAILTTYGYFNAHNIQKTTYTITSNKNLQQDYKIALISDLHFGNNFDLDKLKKQVEIISNSNPDFVILAGDIIDEQTEVNNYEQIFNILSTIKSNYGIYYVLGNHDENKYISTNDDRNERLKNAIKNSSLQILNDESKMINSDLIISGRNDYSYSQTGNRISAANLIKNLDKEKFLLVADHQPNQYKENKNAGYDLQVSGHTHAGQVWPFGLITSSIGFDYGLLKEDNFHLIVSSGMGLWGIPVRTEEKSEYVIIELKNKEL